VQEGPYDMVERPKSFEEWFELMPNAMLIDNKTKQIQSMFGSILELDAERKRKAKELRKMNEDYIKKVDAFYNYAKEIKRDELSD
jgi:hypothetical protein